jgi:hypothetical protein
VIWIHRESEELRSLIATHGVERPPFVIGSIVGEPKRGQQFAVKLHRLLEVFYAQINVIKVACLHFAVVDFECSKLTHYPELAALSR